MKKAYCELIIIKFALLISIVLIQGCSNPSITNIRHKELGAITKESTIYIPRFEGKPDFVEESTDYFVSLLESKIPNNIIQASALRLESADIKRGGNLAPLEMALFVAREKSADILIMGKVTSHKTEGSLNGFSTIRIYNVNNGERIANFHRPSGMLMAFSEHQCVMAALKRTVKDVVGIF